MISHFDWQLVHILPIEVVPDVVIAGTVIATEVSRERGEDPSRGELQEPAVRDGVEAMAPGVVDLPLQAVPHAFHGRQLKPVIVAVGAGRKLRHCGESRIGRLHVGERSKASLTDGLVSIDLREIRLIHRPSAYILRLNAAGISELMLDSQTPFHKVRSVKLALRNRRDGDRGQTCRRACERRCAGKLALREACIEPLIRRDGCIDRAVGHSGRYGRAAHGSQQPALEGLNVWRIYSDQVGNTPGQDIAENAEAGSKNGVGFEPVSYTHLT